MGDRLVMFSGTECVHCKEMDPLLEQLEKETGIKIEHVEVWHNAKNAAFLEKLDKNPDGSVFCGGIPLFWSEKTGKKMCGNQKYEKLKSWALESRGTDASADSNPDNSGAGPKIA